MKKVAVFLVSIVFFGALPKDVFASTEAIGFLTTDGIHTVHHVFTFDPSAVSNNSGGPTIASRGHMNVGDFYGTQIRAYGPVAEYWCYNAELTDCAEWGDGDIVPCSGGGCYLGATSEIYLASLDVFNFADTAVVFAKNSGESEATPLSFPLQTECSPGVLCTPYTAPISSVFDHSMATAYSENETVVAFTGESGVRGSGYWYGCYRKADSSAFDFYGYTGANGTSYLCYDGHPAIDYDVDVGTAVYSAASGTVLEANYDNCLGYYVRIQHDDGYTTLYAHLDSINTNNVMVGELIQANVQIGESGNTGTCSSGSHLHFEVRLNNVPVDPYGWEGGGDDPYTQAVNIPLW